MKRMKRPRLQSEGYKKQTEIEVAEHVCRTKVDQDGFTVEFTDDLIGSGVFAKKEFPTGSFLLEYEGDLKKDYKYACRLEKEYEEAGLGSFMYFFRYNEKRMCVDATNNIFSMGRMINDAEKGDLKNNCSMRIIVVDRTPHLCIFATKEIKKGEELRYDYGVPSLPWRMGMREEQSKGNQSESCLNVPSTASNFTGNPLPTAAEKAVMKNDGTQAEADNRISYDTENNNQNTEGPAADFSSSDGSVHVAVNKMSDEKVNSGKSYPDGGSAEADRSRDEYTAVSSDEYDDSIADANYDPSKEQVSDSCSDYENESSKPPRKRHISESSDNSDIIENIPNIQTFLSPLPKRDDIANASYGKSSSTCVQNNDLQNNDLQPADNEQIVCSIQVPMTNNKEYRHYDKQFYCMYCKQPRSKLKKHLLSMHKDEEEVIQKESDPDPNKRTQIYEKVRNIGNHLHNVDVIKTGEGQLCVAYRPRGETCVRAVDYGPCPFCYAYFPKKELWRHNRSCKFSTKTKHKRRSLAISSRMLLPKEAGASVTLQSVTDGMRGDTITRIIRSDPTILAYGEKLCTKHGHDNDQHNYIRQKLREIGRLVQELRKESRDENKQLEDFIDPTNFQIITKCCKLISGYDAKINTYATPSLALKIGHSLQKCLKILIGKGIETGNGNLQRRAEELSKLFEINWTDDVSSNALRTLHHAKRNTSGSALPLANDVKLLSHYLAAESETNASALKESDDESAWVKLNEIVLAQTILFNRRRTGEVSKMTLEDYAKKKLSNIEGDFDGCLSKFEKELCTIFYRTEIIAKRGRISPVLFTKQMISNLDLLVEKRRLINNPLNMFLFPTRTSSTHIRGTDCLRKFAKHCGAQEPERLKSTKLRKHIATMSQLLNLQDNELDVLAQFLGHDIRVHREFYRLPEATVQVAKVSKLLLMMEMGNVPAMTTSIDDINLNENEVIEDNSASSEEEDEQVTCERNPEKVSIKQRASKQKPQKRRPWSAEEKEVVIQRFQRDILRGRLPGKTEIVSLLDTEPVLKNRTWTNIKDFVRNHMKKH